jgi:hypothetical protein
MPFEGYLGYVFPLFLDKLRPYVEAHGGVTILQSRLDATHPELGGLGATASNGYAPSIAIGSGVWWDMSEFFFVDAGVSVDAWGPMRLSGHVALGLPIPLSNL